MKKYETFLNENRQSHFEFSISLYNSNKSEREKIVDELSKNFDMYTYRYGIIYNDRINVIDLQFSIQPNGEMYNYKIAISYSLNAENVISIDDFLKIGMKGILEYFEIKNNTDKYNL